MVILLDTNIILDILLPNPEFCKESSEVVSLADSGKFDFYISASAVTDIYYIARKVLQDSSAVKNIIRKLLKIVSVAGVDEYCILSALDSSWTDFEDSVQYQVAKQLRADYIITRNDKDYQLSEIPIISPINFLSTIQ